MSTAVRPKPQRKPKLRRHCRTDGTQIRPDQGHGSFLSLVKTKESLTHWSVACGASRKAKIPAPFRAGTDAFAIHGRPGAQVALLQSPIFPTVRPRYIKRENFPPVPVDKPH